MAYTSWGIRHYDLNGDGIGATSYNSDTVDEHVYNATDRILTFNLNSYDQFTFNLYLDDPRAAKIRRGTSVIKVFRQIHDDDHDKTLTPDNPIFAGVVNATSKSGINNQLSVSVMSPLWRLQSHFHILNHYLETNPETGEFYTQSELMWRLVELIEEAFPTGNSYIGIDKGAFLWGLPDEPQPVPYFVGMGTNTWSNIFEDLMNRPSSPDIIPGYIHTGSDPTMMVFNTDEKRGVDHFDDAHTPVYFNYHTDPSGSYPPNCDDMTEDEVINPGQSGNYLWVTGTGGPNAGRYASQSNASDVEGSDGAGELGTYMVIVDRSEVKRIDAINELAVSEFAKRKHPIASYTVTLSPVAGLYFGYDYDMGDVIQLNADRGALKITNKRQRIYQVTLSMSQNNVETAEVLVARDFYGRVDSGGDEGT